MWRVINLVGQELKSIPLESVEPEFPIEEEQGFPTTNAPDRVESYQLGGMIEPPTAPSMSPPVPQYKKGGPVDVTDVVKKVAKKVAQEKRHDKWIAEADKKKETIKSGAEVYPMSDKIKHSKKGHKALKEQQINKMAKKIRKQKKKKSK